MPLHSMHELLRIPTHVLESALVSGKYVRYKAENIFGGAASPLLRQPEGPGLVVARLGQRRHRACMPQQHSSALPSV